MKVGKTSLVLIGILVLVGGCLGRTPSSTNASQFRGFPVPTKDEVALIDGKPFSLSTYFDIQMLLPEAKQETIFWVGTAAIAAQNDAARRGIGLSLKSAIETARYANESIPIEEVKESLTQYLGATADLPQPTALRARLETLTSHAIVQRNSQVLAELSRSKR